VRELARLGGGLTAVTTVEPKVRHGRRETRMVWALADPALNARAGEAGTHQAPWPHLAQVCRVRRRRVTVRTGEVEDEVSYAITSLSPQRADAARLLALLRDHWGIENRLHYVRDVTFDEDRSAVRTAAAPQVCAACRNLVIALLRRTGATNIAAACRTFAGRPLLALNLVATAGYQMMK
jgi:predicted transposase YbfD/YdcC